MRDIKKFTASCSAIARRIPTSELRFWLPVAAVLAVAGCSWFSEEPTPPPPEATPAKAEAGKTTPPEPGEGEAMNTGQATQTAENSGKTSYPDINSVPNEAPKPDVSDLAQAQQGLGSDTTNAQHTDETLTMPNESAARPEAPAPANGEQAASVQPTAPETPATPPEVTPGAETPPPAETTEATTTPAPMPEAATPAPTPAPAPAPMPQNEQVASVGTPQPGSQPFEPSGPLNLAPGSLARNPQEAAPSSMTPPPAVAMAPSNPAPSAPTTVAVTPAPVPAPTSLASSGTTPMPGPAASNGSVSVDYSVLSGLGAGAPTGYAPSAASAPMSAPMASPVAAAGVGQAVGYLYFGNDSAALSPADLDVLRQVAQLQRIEGGVLRVVGHASQRTGNLDALAQDRVNQKVSLERATAVARALVDLGVQPMLVQVAAAGDNQTLYAESTPAGEAGNRRADVYLSTN